MKDSLIRKEDAIKALGEEPMVWTDSDFELADRNRWQMDVEALKKLPPVQPESDYKKAFSVACELLIGASLFGTTEETMFKEIMEKEGIVSSLGYERYILDNLSRLTGEDDGTD
jgi:hypothetical protein